QGPRRLPFAGVEVLVNAVVMDDRDVARLPVVPNAVVNFVAGTIENVKCRFVDVSVLLSLAAGGIFLEMNVQRLRPPVLRLHIVAAEVLRAAVQPEVLSLDHARQAPQPVKFLLEAIGACQGADEDPLPVRIMLLVTHAPLAKALSARLIDDD